MLNEKEVLKMIKVTERQIKEYDKLEKHEITEEKFWDYVYLVEQLEDLEEFLGEFYSDVV